MNGGLVVDWSGQIGALGERTMVLVALLDFIVSIFIDFCSFENIGSWCWCHTLWVMVNVSSDFGGRLMAAT